MTPSVADLILSACHPILPFCYFTLKTSRTAVRLRKLVQKGFKIRPVTLGQHLRSRRLILKLTQTQAAERLNTLREHYERWKRDEVAPTASFWPRLIGFLGSYPWAIQSPGDQVLMARRRLGLSQFALGRKIQVIAKNVREWEHGVAAPSPAMLAKVQKLVADTPVVGLAPM